MTDAGSAVLAPPLGDLLGARWVFGAAVAGVAWDGPDRAGFALRDGMLVVARAAWAGGPELEDRAAGGLAVVPPRVSDPPVSRTRLHEGGCLAVATHPTGGFLTGGADGRLLQVEPDGSHRVLARLDGQRIGVVAACAGWRAGAAGRHVRLFGAHQAVFDAGERVWDMSFDPSGQSLAIGHDAGVTLWHEARALEKLTGRSPPRALAWHPDGHLLAAHLADGSLKVWTVGSERAAVRLGVETAAHAACFTGDGAWLVTAGPEGALAWQLVEAVPPVVVGTRQDCQVTRIAGHPTQARVAVGYRDGAVLLGQPQTPDVLFVRRGGDGGAITALAWAPDGECLAYGTRDGDAGLVRLPARLFRAPPGGAGGHI